MVTRCFRTELVSRQKCQSVRQLAVHSFIDSADEEPCLTCRPDSENKVGFPRNVSL